MYYRRALLKLHRISGQECHRLLFHHDRTCPICGFTGNFRPSGLYYVRPDAICRGCGSVERHRLFQIWFDRNKELFAGKVVLHFAPEEAVMQFVRPVAGKYVTADLFSTDVDHNWNIEGIDCEKDEFDVIICNHVLEHVDCRLALSELHRIIKPGGAAIITIPICEGLDVTYENSEAANGSDEDRYLHFQQPDHIRIFGRDFRDRVCEAGFELDEYNAPGDEVVKYGLVMGEKIFILKVP